MLLSVELDAEEVACGRKASVCFLVFTPLLQSHITRCSTVSESEALKAASRPQKQQKDKATWMVKQMKKQTVKKTKARKQTVEKPKARKQTVEKPKARKQSRVLHTHTYTLTHTLCLPV